MRDLGEGTVAVVVEKAQWSHGKVEGPEIQGVHVRFFHVTDNDEVQMAVPVIVAPGAAHGPVAGVGVAQAGEIRHVVEGSRAIVVERVCWCPSW